MIGDWSLNRRANPCDDRNHMPNMYVWLAHHETHTGGSYKLHEVRYSKTNNKYHVCIDIQTTHHCAFAGMESSE